jgi:hypothetical protein
VRRRSAGRPGRSRGHASAGSAVPGISGSGETGGRSSTTTASTDHGIGHRSAHPYTTAVTTATTNRKRKRKDGTKERKERRNNLVPLFSVRKEKSTCEATQASAWLGVESFSPFFCCGFFFFFLLLLLLLLCGPCRLWDDDNKNGRRSQNLRLAVFRRGWSRQCTMGTFGWHGAPHSGLMRTHGI